MHYTSLNTDGVWCSSKGCSKISQSCQTGTAFTRSASFGDDNQLHYKFGNPWIFLFSFLLLFFSSSSFQTWMGWNNKTRCNHVINSNSFFTHNQTWFASMISLMDPLYGGGGDSLNYRTCVITNFTQNSRTGVRREVKKNWFGGHEGGGGVVSGWPLSNTVGYSSNGSGVGLMRRADLLLISLFNDTSQLVRYIAFS
jgi:hypothetical protein